MQIAGRHTRVLHNGVTEGIFTHHVFYSKGKCEVCGTLSLFISTILFVTAKCGWPTTFCLISFLFSRGLEVMTACSSVGNSASGGHRLYSQQNFYSHPLESKILALGVLVPFLCKKFGIPNK